MMDSLDVMQHLLPVTRLLRALAQAEPEGEELWKNALEAYKVVWCCFEDCALAPGSTWTMEQYLKGP